MPPRRKGPFFEREEEITCPECGDAVSVHAEICPHCEYELL